MSLATAASAGQSILTGANALWTAIIAADVVFHVVLMIRGPVRPGGPQNEVENIRQGLTETPEHVLADIAARRHAAIALLRSRGLVDDAAAATADAAPPGELGLTMAPELARNLTGAALSTDPDDRRV